MSLSVVELSSQKQFDQWNAFVAKHPEGTFTQTSCWANLKQQFGWQPHHIVVQQNQRIVAGCLMMDRKGPFGQAISYAPYGPLLSQNQEVNSQLLQELIQSSRQSVVLRVEPHYSGQSNAASQMFRDTRFTPRPTMLQPESTLIIDLNQSEDKLLSGMRQTTRRYIRKAEKLKLQVEVDITGQRLPEFYELLAKVNQRKNFGIHTLEYYQAAWKSLHSPQALPQPSDTQGSKLLSQPYLFFVFNSHGQSLGAYFLTRLGNKSWELYGGVAEEGMSQKANYLLKWKAIQHMKAEGVQIYDQWGIAPAQAVDNHPLAGVTYFKQGFGGQTISYTGGWDYPHQPLQYRLARMVKKL